MYSEVLAFWFDEIDPASWWKKDETFDRTVETRFGELHRQACMGELFTWRKRADGRLAEIILLDQFSRNIYRDKPEAFAWDGMALVLAQEAVSIGADMALSKPQRRFLYMPYMHSESATIHLQAEQLFRSAGSDDAYDYELKHKAIIDRFGRYPHRNSILGRESTAEEVEFLSQPGSSF
ncbi:DUF924 domain-containing protein [Marinobacterium sp. D7]|uniref:DUF924 family protein n=1 Tax=Marinobacterium ramblicola TaxID=2849041 RepID=UPI001C2DA848|nr:DUF924 family protein [Marinobacterium ramblicola]MBV1790162.1 DUF924 domain-containing protein [Marinobacterium ramblicola]